MDGLAILYVVFCFVICGFAIWVYSKKKDDVPLYFGIAYGLFTIERFMNLWTLASGLNTVSIVIRIVAYLFVFFALYRALVKK
jgi:hypothetical protein